MVWRVARGTKHCQRWLSLQLREFPKLWWRELPKLLSCGQAGAWADEAGATMGVWVQLQEFLKRCARKFPKRRPCDQEGDEAGSCMPRLEL